MTGSLLALALILLVGNDPRTAVVPEGPALTIDPCVAVDTETVRQVMELEIADARQLPTSVLVRCVEGAQEIRIGRSNPIGHENVRILPLAQSFGEDTSGARQARSRELALSIAEFIRWPGPNANLPPTVPTPPMPAPEPVFNLAIVPTSAREAPNGRWQVAVQSAFEHYSRGQNLLGADLSLGMRLGRWFLSEFRMAGRWGADQTISRVHLSTRAAVVAASAGVIRWSSDHVVGGALLLRAQGYWVQFHATNTTDGNSATAARCAVAVLIEPRFLVALTPHFSLQAAAAAGLVPSGITVRIQGVPAQTMSGLAVAANLAGVLTF